jgi:hypothetical protein
MIRFRQTTATGWLPRPTRITIGASERSRGCSPNRNPSGAETGMKHIQRNGLLAAIVLNALNRHMHMFDTQYDIIILITFTTFSWVVMASRLWSKRSDPTMPTPRGIGLRTMLIAIALIAMEMAALNKWNEWNQTTYLRQKYLDASSHHGFWAQGTRGDARLNLEFSVDAPNDTARDREYKKYLRDTAKADSEEAAYHDSLRQKYEQAAQFPLRPVAPDPPPPEKPKRPHGLEKLEPDRPIE